MPRPGEFRERVAVAAPAIVTPVGCRVNFDAKFANGSPVPFASVDVFEVRGFLWWQLDVPVASKTAGFGGTTFFDLDRGKTYHFRVAGVEPSGQRKVRDVWRTINYCPYLVSVWLP